MSEQKNVLFIVIDQFRADCLIGALARHVNLPNLRKLMDDSVSFSNHFSVVNPCGPSRASLLTGQYAMNHRSIRNGTPLRHDTPTVATEARKAGYLPMLFGYCDVSSDPRQFHPSDPSMRTYEHPAPGFHEVVEMRLEMSFPWRSHLLNKGYKFDQYMDVYKPITPEGQEPQVNDPAMYRAEDSDTAFLTDEFLRRMPGYKGENWFAHLTYIRPHPPLVAPEPYNKMYDPECLPMPERLDSAEEEQQVHPFIAPAQAKATAAKCVAGFPELAASDENVQKLRSVYLGLATEVDHHIGRVIHFLKESGQYDDTMIVVTADHGEMLGDHHAWGKLHVYDAAFRTPLIVRVPGNEAHAGAQVDLPTESVDVTPTILDWMGQERPNAMDGRSLMPLLSGDVPEAWKSYTFSEVDFAEPENPTSFEESLGTGPSDSSLGILRDERFTLVEFAAGLPPILFDHDGQGEFANVAEDPAYAEDLARLTRQMLRHRMRNQDHTLSLNTITTDGPKQQVRYPS